MEFGKIFLPKEIDYDLSNFSAVCLKNYNQDKSGRLSRGFYYVEYLISRKGRYI